MTGQTDASPAHQDEPPASSSDSALGVQSLTEEKPKFVHLHTHSYYSFFDSTMSPEEMVSQAAADGAEALALTDTNSLTGVVVFYKAARQMGIKPVIGVELTQPLPAERKLFRARARVGRTALPAEDTKEQISLSNGARRCGGSQSPALCHGDFSQRAVLLARSFAGYSEISQVVTRRMLEPGFDLVGELCGLSEQVIVLSDSIEVLSSVWNWRTGRGEQPAAAKMEASADVPLLYGLLVASRRRRKQNRQVYDCTRRLGIPLTVGCDAKLAKPSDASLHVLLQAMRSLTTVQRIPEADRVDPAQHLQPARKVYEHFCLQLAGSQFLASKGLDSETAVFRGTLYEAVQNTRRIAENCNCELPLKEWRFPRLRNLSRPPAVLLRELVLKGMHRRYGSPLPSAAEQRMNSELEVIDRLGFNEYFLLVSEIVSEANRRGFFTLGRGSGANSILSYALGFTNVCPIQFNLYFERFLNPDRSAPPDIDIDFSWRERDEIIQWCFDRFGHENVALICTLQTLQSRQAVREVAKAHGLCELEVNTFNRLGETGYRVEEQGGRIRNMAEEEPWRTVLQQAQRITNFPRHLSIHCGGILITPGPVADFVPLTRSAKGFVITQMDMFSVEDLGLVKIDLLSNRSLGVLKDAIQMVEFNATATGFENGVLRSECREVGPLADAVLPDRTAMQKEPEIATGAEAEFRSVGNISTSPEIFQREAVRMKLAGTRRGTSVALAGVLGAFSESGQMIGEASKVTRESPLRERLLDFSHVTNDAATRSLIDAGRTMGCFYIESPGMRALFERLRCKNFEEVVTASSIIRPGVAESGMMQEYITRHQLQAEDVSDVKGQQAATALCKQEQQGTLQRETERAGVPGSRSGARVALALDMLAPSAVLEQNSSLSRSETVKCEMSLDDADLRSPTTLLPASPASQRLASGTMPINAHAKAHVFKESLQPEHRSKPGKPGRLQIHPLMMELLPETYGVMVYQEDVLRVAHELAGMTFAEADLLRRAISGKMRSRDSMTKLHGKFVAGAVARGLPEEHAREVWRQMASFAGYSFCKGHSAAFAVLSYQVAYLKAHFPAEFFAGVLSNQGGFYGPGAYLQEARRWGIRVLPPDINHSREEYSGKTESAQKGWLRVGLMAVMNISEASRKNILQIKEQDGAFLSLEDFVARTRAGLEECRMLIKAGAFDELADMEMEQKPSGNSQFMEEGCSARRFHGQDALASIEASGESAHRITPPQRLSFRRRLLLQAECLYRTRHKDSDSFVKLSFPLWRNPPGAPEEEEAGKALHEIASMEQEALGFSITSHPLDLVNVPGEVVLARAIREHRGKRISMAGWVISIKLLATKTDGRTMKMMTLEDRSGIFEAVLFPRVYSRFAPRTLSRGPYLVRGIVDMTLGSPTLNAEFIKVL